MEVEFFKGYFFGGIMAFVTFATLQVFGLGDLSVVIWIIMLLIFHYLSEMVSRHSNG